MMLFYEEIRNKIKNSNKSTIKNGNNAQKVTKRKSFAFNHNNKEKETNLSSNLSKLNNIKKSNSFFLSKKLQELKKIQNIINLKKNGKIENNKKYSKKPNNQFSYTFQNFYNNYPIPEPLPKKIDIRIINDNSEFNTTNNNDTINRNKAREDKSKYDDKKILFILTNLGLEELFCKFKDNFIRYNDLKFLTKDDFIEMKIPIGPRNRIIHFIQELKKNGTSMDFEGLKIFIEKYKKIISGKNQNIKKENNNNVQTSDIFNYSNKFGDFKRSQNSFAISSQFESEKNDNLSHLDKIKNDIINNLSFLSNKKNNVCNNKLNKNLIEDYYFNNNKTKITNNTNQEKYSSENNISYFLNCLENEKENKNNEENINNNYKIKLSKNNNKKPKSITDYGKNVNFNKRCYSQSSLKNNIKKSKPNNKIDNYIYANNFTYNNDYVKVKNFNKNFSNISKYNEYIPNMKNRKNNTKNIFFYRNNIFLKDKRHKTNDLKSTDRVKYNESYRSNISNISRNLLYKLDMINKEFEKYQSNYERLKEKTKRRNKTVSQILSTNIFLFKNNQNYSRYSNSCQSNRNTLYVQHKDLENENERNLKTELNNNNYMINKF